MAGELAEVPGGGWVLRDHVERLSTTPGDRSLSGSSAASTPSCWATPTAACSSRPSGRPTSTPAGGSYRPTVLSDGEVVGTWSLRAGVEAFRRLTAEDRAGLDVELADVERFLGDGPDART